MLTVTHTPQQIAHSVIGIVNHSAKQTQINHGPEKSVAYHVANIPEEKFFFYSKTFFLNNYRQKYFKKKPISECCLPDPVFVPKVNGAAKDSRNAD
jgi:hypothetical protein